MADPFVAEIRVFGFNFAPRGWAVCDGQLLPIAQNTALYSLIGTTYGGNGSSTFALPDLRGAVPMGSGQGPGLAWREQGEKGGSAQVALTADQMPGHTHTLLGSPAEADLRAPGPSRVLATPAEGAAFAPYAAGEKVTLAPEALTTAGGGIGHNNLQPYLTLNFCIALSGVYPPRW